VTTALAARLAPQLLQKRLAAGASAPHAEQRVDDIGREVPEF
jgi:hypothetical protein